MFNPKNKIFHPLETSGLDLPKQFTFPFYYTPHPLCLRAAQEVQEYLETQQDFDHNFGLIEGAKGLIIGKMFGVMLIKAPDGTVGYLVAFSGKLAEQNFIDGFVPPIFDTLNPSGFYKIGEEKLNKINAKIEVLETSKEYLEAKNLVSELSLKSAEEFRAFKANLKDLKRSRNEKRVQARLTLSKDELEVFEKALDKESISLHYQLKHLKSKWKERIAEAQEQLQTIVKRINFLKTKRKELSATLQRQLHQSYSFLNANGQRKDLLDIFETQPPAAAGECAAPKLIQFAYEHNLNPLALAEFWWGAAPKSQVRKHKQFYPACRSKCEPILGHMMLGLDVEKNPISQHNSKKVKLDIIYEDNFILVVNKPSEVLSVPGKTIQDSVLTSLKAYLPEVKGPILVHRLDMSTSGLLIAAKNEKTHKNLQKQFMNRTVHKRYVALLDGEIPLNEGLIDLPLRVDLDNRPTQLVCYDYGKQAQTKYEVVGIENGKTRIHFYPLTGRTHQLRVHAAHNLGLNTPILGDDLYGVKGERLHLHAEKISFEHPVKKKKVTFKVPSPF